MADFVTTNTTADISPGVGLVTVQWYQDTGGRSFVAEMRGQGSIPLTPVAASGGGGRPASGQVWPH